MPELSKRQISLKAIKRQAHYLSKKDNISKGHALELIAQQNGFVCWNDFRIHLLKEGDNTKDKIYLPDFDSSKDDYNQIRGVNFSAEKSSIQVKTSCISLFKHSFSDVNELRLFLDKNIKDIISKSKDSLFICLLIALNENSAYPYDDQDSFFEFILDRYERLQYIEVLSLQEEPTITETLDWISQFDKKMGDFLTGLDK